MSVIINNVTKNSIAQKAGILPGDVLLKISGNDVNDVLDYRFYASYQKCKITVLRNGKKLNFKVNKQEYEELGLEFETYLIDKQQTCKNKCIFCFIDQMPENMRKSLYFKDDDSRLSFLFGNYITLTNLSDHEIKRIKKMHISPINISVHTTNPILRVEMMKNPNAGTSLKIIKQLDKAGISLNFQLVLCPGINDGQELKRSLTDLLKYKCVASIACVPVGVTKFRDGLYPLKTYNKDSAKEVIDIVNSFGDKCKQNLNRRICYASDEFYLTAGINLPSYEFYEDFLQLENGVGMYSLLKSECISALNSFNAQYKKREISVATGVLAYPLLCEIANMCEQKWQGFKCNVYQIENNYFGTTITVAGLITATDIIKQLKGKNLGESLFIPSCMLKQGEDVFLDDIKLSDLQDKLNTKITVTNGSGYDLIDSFAGI